jgi:hypothetical protein
VQVACIVLTVLVIALLLYDRERLIRQLTESYKRNAEREVAADVAREQMFKAMLAARGVPSGAPPPQVDAPAQVWTRDQRDAINDSIQEFMEVQLMNGHPCLPDEARMAVWNRMGFASPQF